MSNLSVDLCYSPRPWQTDYHRGAEGCDDVLAIAARQSGKTEASGAEFLKRVLIGPTNCEYAIIAPFLSQAKRIWVPRLKKLLAELMDHGLCEYRATVAQFVLVDNRVIHIAGADNEGLRGLSLRGILFDELDGIPPAFLSGVALPTQNNFSDSFRLFIGTLGPSELLWRYYEENKHNPGWFCQVINCHDAGIPTDTIERLRASLPPHIFAREMECNPSAPAPHGIFADIRLRPTVRATNRTQGGVVAFDIGIRDFSTAWLFQFDASGKRLVACAYEEAADCGFDEFCLMLKKRWEVLWGAVVLVLPHDGSNRSAAGGDRTPVIIAEEILKPRFAECIPAASGTNQLQAARLVARHTLFAQAASQGIERLKLARFATDRAGNVRDTVVHDDASHGYDAFRTGAYWLIHDGLRPEDLLPTEDEPDTLLEIDPVSVDSSAEFFDRLESTGPTEAKVQLACGSGYTAKFPSRYKRPSNNVKVKRALG